MPYTQATHTFIIRTPIGPTDAPEHVIVSTYASASIETWSDHDKEVPQPCVFPANFTERNRCTWMPNDGRDVLRPSDMRTADSPSGQLVATSHQPPRPTSHGGWDHLYRPDTNTDDVEAVTQRRLPRLGRFSNSLLSSAEFPKIFRTNSAWAKWPTCHRPTSMRAPATPSACTPSTASQAGRSLRMGDN